MGKYQLPATELRELTSGVYAFLQKGIGFSSNAGVIVCKNYVIVIDSLTNKYMVEDLISKIKKVTNKPVRLVFNTHWHTDHTYTNHYFQDAIVFCTPPNRTAMFWLNPIELETFSKIFPEERMNFEGAKIIPQDMTFEGTLTIYDGDREIRFMDMGPGHSNSDCIVYLPKDKIVFCGDLVTKMEDGVEGLTSLFSGSYRLIQSLDTLANIDAEVFVPGHGHMTLTRDEIVHYCIAEIEFLITMREEVRKCFQKGMTYQEAAKKIDYSKFTKWGDEKRLYPVIFAGCARGWSEFCGEPPASLIDMEEVMAKGFPGAPDRLNLGMKGLPRR